MDSIIEKIEKAQEIIKHGLRYGKIGLNFFLDNHWRVDWCRVVSKGETLLVNSPNISLTLSHPCASEVFPKIKETIMYERSPNLTVRIENSTGDERILLGNPHILGIDDRSGIISLIISPDIATVLSSTGEKTEKRKDPSLDRFTNLLED